MTMENWTAAYTRGDLVEFEIRPRTWVPAVIKTVRDTDVAVNVNTMMWAGVWRVAKPEQLRSRQM